MKALKKQDIINQFQALQEKYDSLPKDNKFLLEKNKNYVESIILLEESWNLQDSQLG